MTTSTTTRKVGDKVSITDSKYPGVWTIKSLGPVNAVLTPENGSRSLRAPHYMLVDPNTAQVTTFPATYYVVGELVRVTEVSKYAGLYVVIKDGGTDKVNLAKLGGDNDRYLRMPKRSVVKVDPAEVLK